MRHGCVCTVTVEGSWREEIAALRQRHPDALQAVTRYNFGSMMQVQVPRYEYSR